MVEAVETGTIGIKGIGGSGSGRVRGEGRGRGRSVCGNRQEPKTWDITYHIKYIVGTESSVPMDSVLVL